MDIKYAILGFLSWKSLTGYELKKLMAGSEIFYWSGNNNQIYTSLVQLHGEELVTNDIMHQEHLPSRKTYSITIKGLEVLKEWLCSTPELPTTRKAFFIQLAWSNLLSDLELDTLIRSYEQEVQMALLMHKAEGPRNHNFNPARNRREELIWDMIYNSFINSYEAELLWLQELRKRLFCK
jgi:PadR family transcriptional regulator, regulatory protein AphA